MFNLIAVNFSDDGNEQAMDIVVVKGAGQWGAGRRISSCVRRPAASFDLAARADDHAAKVRVSEDLDPLRAHLPLDRTYLSYFKLQWLPIILQPRAVFGTNNTYLCKFSYASGFTHGQSKLGFVVAISLNSFDLRCYYKTIDKQCAQYNFEVTYYLPTLKNLSPTASITPNCFIWMRIRRFAISTST